MISLGIDIGSTTSKCVLFKEKSILASSLIESGVGTSGARKAIEQALQTAGLTLSEVDVSAVTGYGRNRYQDADFAPSELTCHSLGVHLLCPSARTVIDIGGQDAKIILLDEAGRMKDFRMNDKCAAGTGRFLDVMARLMGLSLDEMDELAQKSTAPASISSTCTVFAESEVISQLSSQTPPEDIAAGIFRLAAIRAAALAKSGGFAPPVFFSGGCWPSLTLRRMLSEALDTELIFHPLSQHAGALGAAVYAETHTKGGQRHE